MFKDDDEGFDKAHAAAQRVSGISGYASKRLTVLFGLS